MLHRQPYASSQRLHAERIYVAEGRCLTQRRNAMQAEASHTNDYLLETEGMFWKGLVRFVTCQGIWLGIRTFEHSHISTARRLMNLPRWLYKGDTLHRMIQDLFRERVYVVYPGPLCHKVYRSVERVIL
jgi:hypothetical protein